MDSTVSTIDCKKNNNAKLITFFSALCLFLSVIEYAIPKPLPFMRLGLSNLPVILALTVLKKREILLLVFFKILAQGVISGTILSYIFVFSSAGSFSAALMMILVYSLFKSKISCLGISLAGALANNAAQIIVANFFLFGSNTKFIAPVLLITGFITGTFLGIFTEAFISKSRWYKLLTKKNKPEVTE